MPARYVGVGFQECDKICLWWDRESPQASMVARNLYLLLQAASANVNAWGCAVEEGVANFGNHQGKVRGG
jgi:hypothetical protein